MKNRVVQKLFIGLALLSSVGITSAQEASTNAIAPASGRGPVAATAPTSVPALVPFSGTAFDNKGNALAGDLSATFQIYKEETGGEPLFTESQMIGVDSTGHYKVQLGAADPNGLPADLFATGEARWLEVQIAGQPAQPRVLLASVPYALKAADAATLGGLPASAFALAGTRTNANLAAFAPSVVTPDGVTDVTTTGGTTGYLPVFTGASAVGNSILYASSTGVGVGDVPNSTAVFDVNGKSIWRGLLNVSRSGTATASTSYPSFAMFFQASAYDSSSKSAHYPAFQLQAEPAGNNTASPAGTFNLLYTSNSSTPAETGLYFNADGTIHFATGQTFPGAGGGSGGGTITGVKAGTGLTGGGTSGSVTLNVDNTVIPTLTGNNTYTGSNVFVPSIYEDTDVNIDYTNANSGGVSPGLRFGQASGEGMASQRVSGGDNQYGLDFFTDYTRRMSISGDGYIAIGSAPAEGFMLSVTGGAEAGHFENNSSYDPAIYAGNLYASGGVPVLETYGEDGVCTIDTSSDIDCEGTLTGSSKSFKIDHPLDPANKYLVHASVESSEMMNIYSGNVTTDELGLATVTLPDWFEAENGDFRYQLTTIGRDAHAWVSQEVSNGKFQISTNATNVKVSWQITAVRQDGYAKTHPLVPEQEKAAKDRGLYRSPEAFGQPKEKGIAWARRVAQAATSKSAAAGKNPTLAAGQNTIATSAAKTANP